MRDDARTVRDLVDDVGLFRAHGLPPRGGGLLDQEAKFLEAVKIVESEIQKLQTWKADQ